MTPGEAMTAYREHVRTCADCARRDCRTGDALWAEYVATGKRS